MNTSSVANAHVSSFIPMVVDKEGNAERAYDIFSRILKDRIVFLTGPIDDHVASVICAQLLFLDNEDHKKDIHLYINSPGGVVTASFAILDTMNLIKSSVQTICLGQAASAGSLLLCCGTKGKRFITPNARVMTHQPSGGASGQASDIIIQAQEITRMRESLIHIYMQQTGKSREKIEDALERDRFFTAQEAVAFGLVDSVL